jgi:hypothetical protein
MSWRRKTPGAVVDEDEVVHHAEHLLGNCKAICATYAVPSLTDELFNLLVLSS